MKTILVVSTVLFTIWGYTDESRVSASEVQEATASHGTAASEPAAPDTSNQEAEKPAPRVLGTLTINNEGGLILEENATYRWEYDDTSADSVKVNGDVRLPSVLHVNVIPLGTKPLNGSKILLEWSGVNTGVTDLSRWRLGPNLEVIYDAVNKRVLIRATDNGRRRDG